MNFSTIEQKINYQLNKIPFIKVGIKRCYQLLMYTVSPKIKSEGNIIRVSPDDPTNEYFFGYYDKSPWDESGRYMLCMRAKCTWKEAAPREPAEILLIDTLHPDQAPRVIAITHTWNVQQGCMAGWLGPNFSKRIIYNDLRDNKYCSVILDIETGKERIVPMPIYSVSNDGMTALSLDFSRLHRLRPGYGYSNIPDSTKTDQIPDQPCVWRIDLETNECTPILTYTDLAHFQSRPEMGGATHKVNHLMITPNGKRFMVLHRWFNGQRKYTRLVTCNIDGSDLYNLSDCDMVSHCYWRDDEHILAFENKFGTGPGYYLMTDKTHEYSQLWPNLTNDGHPSYSPDNQFIVTDSYPNRARIASIRVLSESTENAADQSIVARVFAPFKYDNDTRCDLHPRWKRDGSQICFDSVFEGHRGLYIINAPK